jgi:DNA-binding Lrp family transcriptional regulator
MGRVAYTLGDLLGTTSLSRGQQESLVLRRVQELIKDRIIRQVTPIYDTRAFGYGSMLVAAKVDPEHPWRAARIINSHPGVSHNYLRNHEFNMWFTLAVEEDSALGLDGTLDVLQELTGAESIRQLPTLKLFKIRMDLELVGGTDELAKSAVAEDPIELGYAGCNATRLRRLDVDEAQDRLGWRHGRRPTDDVFDERPERIAAGTFPEPATRGVAAVCTGVVDGRLGHRASLGAGPDGNRDDSGTKSSRRRGRARVVHDATRN